MPKTRLEKFDSVSAFVHTLGARKENTFFEPRVKKGTLASFKADEHAYRFTATKSWDEAQDLLAHGDEKTMRKIEQVNVEYKKTTSTTLRTRQFRATHGFMPCVPAYLANSPRAMIFAKKTRPVGTKVLTIIVSSTLCSSVRAEDIAAASAKILSAISAIETRGYRTNLHIYSIVETPNTKNIYAFLMKIKDSGTYFDKLKMAYPLANPSFLRRHSFRYLETCDLLSEEDDLYSYGWVVSDTKAKEELEKAHVSYDAFISVEDIINRRLSTEQIVGIILGGGK